MDPPWRGGGCGALRLHSNYHPVKTSEQNNRLHRFPGSNPLDRLSCHFGLAIGSTESAILKK